VIDNIAESADRPIQVRGLCQQDLPLSDPFVSARNYIPVSFTDRVHLHKAMRIRTVNILYDPSRFPCYTRDISLKGIGIFWAGIVGKRLIV
jgi:hypothetical protein